MDPYCVSLGSCLIEDFVMYHGPAEVHMLQTAVTSQGQFLDDHKQRLQQMDRVMEDLLQTSTGNRQATAPPYSVFT